MVLEKVEIPKYIFSGIEFRAIRTSNSDSTGTSYCFLFVLIDSIEPVRDEKKDRTSETAHL